MSESASSEADSGGTGYPFSMTVPKLWEAIREDLEQMARVKDADYPTLGGLLDVLSLPGTWAVILYRLASTAHHKGIKPLSRFIFFLNSVLFGAELHPGSIIQPGFVLPHPVGATVASGTRIGRRALFLRQVGLGGSANPKRPGHPVLGDDVIVMDTGKVLGPAHIGDRCIVGANAIVITDIEADVFVYGARKSDVVRPLVEMGLDGHVAERASKGSAKQRREFAATHGNSQNGHPADGDLAKTR